MTPEAIIETLELEPHPEGGHYRRVYQSDHTVAGRPVATAIYFLLGAGEVSRWHRVDADELWHYYAGSPLELSRAPEKGPLVRETLGPNLLAGERPQLLVPRGHWQSARSLGPWTLIGATVSPGFVFSGFELAPADFVP